MVEAIPENDTQKNLDEQKQIASSLTFGEADVGIQLFYADIDSESQDLASLRCAFKHRFSDFIVNEIDEAGEVVWYAKEENLQKWKPQNIEQTLPA